MRAPCRLTPLQILLNPPGVFLGLRIPCLVLPVVLVTSLAGVPADLVAWLAASGIAAIFTAAALGGLRARAIEAWVAFDRGRLVTSEPPEPGGPFGGEYVHARLVLQPGGLGVVVLRDPEVPATLLLPRTAYAALRAAGMPDVPRHVG